jgi:hypothetical protein
VVIKNSVRPIRQISLDIILNGCVVPMFLIVDLHTVLCGDGFMDFIHRPKSKILKILKN